MKIISKLAAQGDVLFQRIDSLPKNVARDPSLVVAHSETGHHHVARARSGFDCERYTDTENPLVSYLRIRRVGESLEARADKAIKAIDAVLIEHERSFHRHETLALACEAEEAVYRVVRQRQMSPEGWQAVRD